MSSEDDDEFLLECKSELEDLRESHYDQIAGWLDEATECENAAELYEIIRAVMVATNHFRNGVMAIQQNIKRRQERGT